MSIRRWESECWSVGVGCIQIFIFDCACESLGGDLEIIMKELDRYILGDFSRTFYTTTPLLIGFLSAYTSFRFLTLPFKLVPLFLRFKF